MRRKNLFFLCFPYFKTRRNLSVFVQQMVLRELLSVDGEGYGEETRTTITIVITDMDDELPVFSRDKVAVPIPEDVGRSQE